MGSAHAQRAHRSRIGEEPGLSQLHVSRLLKKTSARIRRRTELPAAATA